jgi:hypothetical protein
MQKTVDIQSYSTAWSIAIGNFAAVSGVGFILGTFVIGDGIGFLFVFGMIILAAIQSYYIFIANKNYTINMETATLSIPKSGYGQTDSWKISVDLYWNLMKRQIINISDIQDVIVETKRSETANEERTGDKEVHINYLLKIITDDNSTFFKFKSREKRNEISSAICQAVQDVTGKELSCEDDYRTGRADKTLDSMMNNF